MAKRIMIIVWKWADDCIKEEKFNNDSLVIPVREHEEQIMEKIEKLIKPDGNFLIMVHCIEGNPEYETRCNLFEEIKRKFGQQKNVKIKNFGGGAVEIYYDYDKDTGLLDTNCFGDDVDVKHFDSVWKYYWYDKDEKKKIVFEVLTLFLHFERVSRFGNYSTESLEKIGVELSSLKDDLDKKNKESWYEIFSQKKEVEVWNFIKKFIVSNNELLEKKLKEKTKENFIEEIRNHLTNLKKWAEI